MATINATSATPAATQSAMTVDDTSYVKLRISLTRLRRNAANARIWAVTAPMPLPNQVLIDDILSARAHRPAEVRFIRAIAQGAPEWVPTITIENQLGINSSQLANAHSQIRRWVNSNRSREIPLPWGHFRSPGSGHPASYLMTTELSVFVLQHPTVTNLP
jgi:hypothetical protein